MTDPAFAAYNGLRIVLPNGKTLVSRTPLPFPTATKWLELLERYDNGEPYSGTLKVVLEELPSAAGIEDMRVLDDLTLGEVIHFAIYRFFFQRRTPDSTTRLSPGSHPTAPNEAPPA